ncbi:ABC transporter permease [Bacillus xiapuensis]|uniref:hypothetical protein n=1 Tax=Bacillus xiapuensis TaxID=2014075 RepID=UPI000C24E58C|nr:hypothetical protein [Bacillus xiapuensis]
MTALTSLLRSDAKQLYRDPMFALIFLTPCLLILFSRFGIPLIGDKLQLYFDWDWMHYRSLIISFFMLLIPLMNGIMTGFIMLDERDESIISYLSVTPLTKRGYFYYRLAIPMVFTLLGSTLFFLFSSIDSPHIAVVILLVPMLMLSSAIITLLQAAFAANKIEGLALSKGIGLIVFAPFIAYFLPLPWQIFASLLPMFWPAKLYLMGMENPWTFILLWTAGIAYHLLFIKLLIKKFLIRAE